MLKNIPREKAVAWFVKMRARLANEPIIVGETPVHITVSMGLALGADVEFEELLDLADGALYEAKRGGRNRVEIAHFGG